MDSSGVIEIKIVDVKGFNYISRLCQFTFLQRFLIEIHLFKYISFLIILNCIYKLLYNRVHKKIVKIVMKYRIQNISIQLKSFFY